MASSKSGKSGKSGNFIQSAIKHPGGLHQCTNTPPGQKIPASKIAAAAKGGGVCAKRANLAKTLSKLRGK